MNSSRFFDKVVGWSETDTVTSTVFSELSYYLIATTLSLIIIKLAIENKTWNWSWKKSQVTENGEKIYGLEAVPGPKPIYPLYVGNSCQLWPISQTINITVGWFKEHGPLYKFYGSGKVIVMINSAPIVQAVLKSGNFHHVKKNVAYDLMKPFITNGVLVSEGKFWQRERKILLRSMQFQSLRAYITMLNTHSQRFVDSLEKLFSDGKVHTINELISSSFLEVICEMITGYDIHNTAEGVEYHHNFQKWKQAIAYRLMHPWFVPKLLWKLNPLSWTTDRAVQGLFDFARRRIAQHKKQRLEAEEKKRQMYDINDNFEEPEKGEKTAFRSVLDELMDAGVTDDQIVDEVNTMLFGGHETGASTMHFFCFAMALNPDMQELCRKEVEEVFQDPMLVQDGKMSYECFTNLKYLERCILETLRMYPPVFVFVRDITEPLRIEYQNKQIDLPVATNICLYPYSIHRNPEYFPDPERFDPDRFLPEECAKRPAYSYIPFSGGPRNCLGLKFAMIEMKMIASYLLRNFDIYTTDTVEDVTLLPNLTLTPDRDMNFIFKKRDL